MADELIPFSAKQLEGPFSRVLEEPLIPFTHNQERPSGFTGAGGQAANIATNFLQGMNRGRMMRYAREENERFKKIQIFDNAMNNALQIPDLTDEQRKQIGNVRAMGWASAVQHSMAKDGGGKGKGKQPEGVVGHITGALKHIAEGMTGGPLPKGSPEIPIDTMLAGLAAVTAAPGKQQRIGEAQKELAGVVAEHTAKVGGDPSKVTAQDIQRDDKFQKAYQKLLQYGGKQHADSIVGTALGGFKNEPGKAYQEDLNQKFEAFESAFGRKPNEQERHEMSASTLGMKSPNAPKWGPRYVAGDGKWYQDRYENGIKVGIDPSSPTNATSVKDMSHPMLGSDLVSRGIIADRFGMKIDPSKKYFERVEAGESKGWGPGEERGDAYVIKQEDGSFVYLPKDPSKLNQGAAGSAGDKKASRLANPQLAPTAFNPDTGHVNNNPFAKKGGAQPGQPGSQAPGTVTKAGGMVRVARATKPDKSSEKEHYLPVQVQQQIGRVRVAKQGLSDLIKVLESKDTNGRPLYEQNTPWDRIKRTGEWTRYRTGLASPDGLQNYLSQGVALLQLEEAAPFLSLGRGVRMFEEFKKHTTDPQDTPKLMYEKAKHLSQEYDRMEDLAVSLATMRVKGGKLIEGSGSPPPSRNESRQDDTANPYR